MRMGEELKQGGRCEKHNLAMGPQGTCVLCRRASDSTGVARAAPTTDATAVSDGPGSTGGADAFTKARARLTWGHDCETVIKAAKR